MDALKSAKGVSYTRLGYRFDQTAESGEKCYFHSVLHFGSVLFVQNSDTEKWRLLFTGSVKGASIKVSTHSSRPEVLHLDTFYMNIYNKKKKKTYEKDFLILQNVQCFFKNVF